MGGLDPDAVSAAAVPPFPWKTGVDVAAQLVSTVMHRLPFAGPGDFWAHMAPRPYPLPPP